MYSFFHSRGPADPIRLFGCARVGCEHWHPTCLRDLVAFELLSMVNNLVCANGLDAFEILQISDNLEKVGINSFGGEDDPAQRSLSFSTSPSSFHLHLSISIFRIRPQPSPQTLLGPGPNYQVKWLSRTSSHFKLPAYSARSMR